MWFGQVAAWSFERELNLYELEKSFIDIYLYKVALFYHSHAMQKAWKKYISITVTLVYKKNVITFTCQ